MSDLKSAPKNARFAAESVSRRVMLGALLGGVAWAKKEKAKISEDDLVQISVVTLQPNKPAGILQCDETGSCGGQAIGYAVAVPQACREKNPHGLDHVNSGDIITPGVYGTREWITEVSFVTTKPTTGQFHSARRYLGREHVKDMAPAKGCGYMSRYVKLWHLDPDGQGGWSKKPYEPDGSGETFKVLVASGHATISGKYRASSIWILPEAKDWDPNASSVKSVLDEIKKNKRPMASTECR